MAKKKNTRSRTKNSSVRVKSQNASSFANAAARKFGRFVVPLTICCILIVGISFLGFLGLQTATASAFFGLRNVEVGGTVRTSPDEIKRVVASAAEKTGVWNADLADIRAKVEKFPFVKTASVSRVLPAAIRVNVIERVPAAIVHLSAGNFLMDTDGTVLTAATANDKDPPFVLNGWDEAKTEKAMPDNQARLKIYRKMVDEWQQFDLVSRVREVNLSNVRQPVAVIEDSGRNIPVSLARDNLGKSLKMAIEAVSGKGSKIRSVDASGLYPVIQYLDF
jgi:cell division septal protein FtsQ